MLTIRVCLFVDISVTSTIAGKDLDSDDLMMRLLIACAPGYGHIFPNIALARLAIRDGHDVKLATGRQFQATVEAAGVPFYPAGPDWRVNPQEAFTMFWQGSPPIFASDLLKLFESWQPDVIVRDHVEFGSWFAAEKVGIPFATLPQGLPASPLKLPENLIDMLNQIRQSMALPPISSPTEAHQYLFLELFPPSWVRRRDYEPDTLHYIPPLLYTPDHDWQEPDWFNADGDRPFILCTMGTVFNHNHDLIKRFIDALSSVDAEIIITASNNFNSDESVSIPDHIHLEPFVPLSRIMSRCRLVICHGGLGTVMSAISHNVPLVTIPVGANQPTVSWHCEQSGVAVQVLGDTPRQSAFGMAADLDTITADAIRDATHTVLDNGRFVEQTRKLRKELYDAGDETRVIQLLNTLAQTREPLFR